MTTCRNCGVSSRTGGFDIERIEEDEKPALAGWRAELGFYVPELRLVHRACGWSICGFVDFATDSFVGIPSTERVE